MTTLNSTCSGDFLSTLEIVLTTLKTLNVLVAPFFLMETLLMILSLDKKFGVTYQVNTSLLCATTQTIKA